MTDIRKKTIQGLAEGDSFSVSRIFNETETIEFADMTKDYNPVHFDKKFTEAKGLKGKICHGMLVGSMISEIGGQIGWLASEMQFNFKKPVYFGDKVTCKMVITEINEKRWATAKAEYKNQDGLLVMEAFLKGIIPGQKEIDIMAKTISDEARL